MAAPSMTLNQVAIANSSPAASGIVWSGSTPIDLRTKFEGQFQASLHFGAVAATAGVLVESFRIVDSASSVAGCDTIAVVSFLMGARTSTDCHVSWTLPTGLWTLKLTNTDATNGVSHCCVTYATVDSIA